MTVQVLLARKRSLALGAIVYTGVARGGLGAVRTMVVDGVVIVGISYI